jgi:hypothetical protein
MMIGHRTFPLGTLVVFGCVAILISIPFSMVGDGSSRDPTHAGVGSTTGSRPQPVVDHPFPVAAGTGGPAPAVTYSHWWAGGYFSGTSFNSTQLSVALRIPDVIPSTQEFYYVLLSVWDDAGSYDQIGIANDYGVWGWTWSYTSNCAGSYYYTPNQMALTRGVQYTFSMGLSGGNLTFSVLHAGAPVASLTKHSGGNKFLDQSFYSCSSATYYDYTDYEEAYATVQSMPSFDFFFSGNKASNRSVTGWSSMGSPPGGGTIGLSGSAVSVENEAFWLTFVGGVHSKTVARNVTNYSTNVTVHPAFSGGNVSLSWKGLTTAFSISFAPTSGTPGFTTTVHIALLSMLSKTPYRILLIATDASGVYSYVTLVLTRA